MPTIDTTTTVPAVKIVKVAKAKPAAAATNGKHTVPDQLNKEIRYTTAKVALLTALVSRNAKSVGTALSVEDIAKASKGKVTDNQVHHQVNPLYDLSVQEIIKRVKGETGSVYYITAKGTKALTKATAK
jgi:hypothetical protein